jgi:hypothetical protein
VFAFIARDFHCVQFHPHCVRAADAAADANQKHREMVENAKAGSSPQSGAEVACSGECDTFRVEIRRPLVARNVRPPPLSVIMSGERGKQLSWFGTPILYPSGHQLSLHPSGL